MDVKNNPEKLSSSNVGEHILCVVPVSTVWAFRDIEKKCDVYRGENCFGRFYKSLRKHAMQITNFEKNKIMSLTN